MYSGDMAMIFKLVKILFVLGTIIPLLLVLARDIRSVVEERNFLDKKDGLE